MKDYFLLQSTVIQNQYHTITDDIRVAHQNFQKTFSTLPNADSTALYRFYNIFAITSPSMAFYNLFKELSGVIRNNLNESGPLWIQAWINYQDQHSVLDWHHHDFDYHGYIAIDPKNTRTVFDNYSIENKPGQIYLGPGYRKHKVEVLEPFEGVRTTLGFDIFKSVSSPYVKYTEKPFLNLGWIPLL
jgi:hypothetical protein